MLKRKTVAVASCILLAVPFLFFIGPDATHAAVSNWQKGVNIVPRWNADYSSATFQQSVKNAAALGVNYITLEIPFHQSNVNSTDIQTGGDTPTDQSIIDGVNYIHSLGLHAALKLQDMPYDGQWSAYINPSDRATWYANYGAMLDHYAAIAQSTGAEELIVGTELISMSAATVNSSNTGNWQTLIANVRAEYSGKLTYDANWGDPGGFSDEINHIQFWSSLDYIGISAYFNLSGDGSVAQLIQSWDGWNKSDIAPLAQKWGKPVIFTEAGFKAIHDSYTHPWMWWESGGADPAQQANDYQALFQYWNGQSFMQGVQLWNWSSDPNAGGPGDTDYTPQGKAAQDVMKTWFTSAPSAPPQFTSAASVTPPSPPTGQAATVAATLTDTGGATQGANVDLEVYDASGAQVFQKIFAGQSFSANGSQNFSASWTPSAEGTYVMKIGVFSGDWGTLYYWNNAAVTFRVGASSGGGSGGTSTVPGAVNIWWPTNGSSVTGVQPFKAMLTNSSVDSYAMFWQVDGGQLNPMATNDTDYPHKEASVDVSPWNWRGAGPYIVTFVAKNSSGQTLATASTSISVMH